MQRGRADDLAKRGPVLRPAIPLDAAVQRMRNAHKPSHPPRYAKQEPGPSKYLQRDYRLQIENCRLKTANLRLAAVNQSSICNSQSAICNLQFSICNSPPQRKPLLLEEPQERRAEAVDLVAAERVVPCPEPVAERVAPCPRRKALSFVEVKELAPHHQRMGEPAQAARQGPQTPGPGPRPAKNPAKSRDRSAGRRTGAADKSGPPARPWPARTTRPGPRGPRCPGSARPARPSRPGAARRGAARPTGPESPTASPRRRSRTRRRKGPGADQPDHHRPGPPYAPLIARKCSSSEGWWTA